jgi:hypothetical protein
MDGQKLYISNRATLLLGLKYYLSAVNWFRGESYGSDTCESESRWKLCFCLTSVNLASNNALVFYEIASFSVSRNTYPSTQAVNITLLYILYIGCEQFN